MGKVEEDTKGDERIRPVERLEILVVVDNYVDLLLPDSRFISRMPVSTGQDIPRGTILAEHGLSLLISIITDNQRHSILFDTGYTDIFITNNMQMLKRDFSAIEAIVLSHFHMDHTGGLESVLRRCRRNIPIFVHPDAFVYPRYMELPNGETRFFPQTLIKEKNKKKGVDLIETEAPHLILNDLAIVTGQIDRVTDFEKGMPNTKIEREGRVEKDLILDDQAIVFHVKDKGIVVISGCAHSGIINTINYARKITGIDQVYAVIGGFHLSGPFFEPAIEPTISELKKLDLELLVPMHCTGWKAIKRMSDEFPSFALSSVGARIVL